MSEQGSEKLPFQSLGQRLKRLREQSRRSLAEVSGAVEIEQAVLERIEAGKERPAEDILMLLINYFDMQDNEATKLWEMAGYSAAASETDRTKEDIQFNGKSIVMLLAMDVRTMYSDALDINCTPAGVTLNFNQLSGQTQPVPVAKVGMSYEQAERVLMTLQQALWQARYIKQPKSLPPPTDTTAN